MSWLREGNNVLPVGAGLKPRALEFGHFGDVVTKNSPPGLGGVPFARFLANGGVVSIMRSHLIDIRAAHRLKRSAARASIRWLRAIPYHPVCANKERAIFLVAQPPLLT